MVSAFRRWHGQDRASRNLEQPNGDTAHNNLSQGGVPATADNDQVGADGFRGFCDHVRRATEAHDMRRELRRDADRVGSDTAACRPRHAQESSNALALQSHASRSQLTTRRCVFQGLTTRSSPASTLSGRQRMHRDVRTQAESSPAAARSRRPA
jgi:hypothetical protein